MTDVFHPLGAVINTQRKCFSGEKRGELIFFSSSKHRFTFIWMLVQFASFNLHDSVCAYKLVPLSKWEIDKCWLCRYHLKVKKIKDLPLGLCVGSFVLNHLIYCHHQWLTDSVWQDLELRPGFSFSVDDSFGHFTLSAIVLSPIGARC